MKVIKKQTNSKMCIICGVETNAGVGASFYEMEDNSVIALFIFFGMLISSWPVL